MAASTIGAQLSNESGTLREQADRNRLISHDNSPAFTLEEFFILGLLKDHELYGLQIVNALAAYSEFGIALGMGVIYPTLKSLVKEGALSSHQANGGPPRVFYAITDLGRQRLRAIASQLAHLGETAQLLAAEARPPV